MTAQQDRLQEVASVTPRSATLIDRPVVIDINLAWHEQVYRDAAGSLSRVPWACGHPNPALVSWLNAEAPGLIRPGSRVVVVGCGLADDVCELADRGYDVYGFDCAPTAISWARERFPSLSTNLMSADLFNLPPRMRHRFDLVVEIDTLQSIQPALREPGVQSLASLAAPHGVVLTICRGRDESELLENVKGPPWPFTVSELCGLMESAGLRPMRAPDDFMDDQPTPVRRLRAAFVRA